MNITPLITRELRKDFNDRDSLDELMKLLGEITESDIMTISEYVDLLIKNDDCEILDSMIEYKYPGYREPLGRILMKAYSKFDTLIEDILCEEGKKYDDRRSLSELYHSHKYSNMVDMVNSLLNYRYVTSFVFDYEFPGKYSLFKEILSSRDLNITQLACERDALRSLTEDIDTPFDMYMLVAGILLEKKPDAAENIRKILRKYIGRNPDVYNNLDELLIITKSDAFDYAFGPDEYGWWEDEYDELWDARRNAKHKVKIE